VAKHATTLYPEEPQITEGGLKQAWKRKREEERRVKEAGMGRVVKWNWKARVMYVQCRTGKGNLQAPGDTRLGSQTTLNAGSVEDMRRQASTSPWSVCTEKT